MRGRAATRAATGAPGYNPANVIARDQNVDRWWKPHDLEQLWSNLPAMAAQ